jgi:hypothetical protein
LGSRIPGTLLALAAALFWLSWLLMPGVGVTDPARIFALVASQRDAVLGSVVVQLLSSVLYVPSLLGIASDAKPGAGTAIRWGAGTLLIGAMGSAADAVLHLLAYAMTAPALDRPALLDVMAFMQGPGLRLLAPLILCFFVGGAWLSLALWRRGDVSRANPWCHAAAVAVAVAGGLSAARGLVPPRAVGLVALGLVAGAQLWAGLALAARAGRPGNA